MSQEPENHHTISKETHAHTTTPAEATTNQESQKLKGFINPKLVNGFALMVITVCILAAVTVSIRAMWGENSQDTLLRSLGTIGVIILGTIVFKGVNTSFGD